MEMTSVAGLALCAALFAALLKSRSREFSLLLSIAACSILFAAVLRRFSPILTQLEALSGSSPAPEAFSAVLRALGVALLGQFTAGLCRDAGENGLAFGVELAARTMILGISLPLLQRLALLLEEMMQAV